MEVSITGKNQPNRWVRWGFFSSFLKGALIKSYVSHLLITTHPFRILAAKAPTLNSLEDLFKFHFLYSSVGFSARDFRTHIHFKAIPLCIKQQGKFQL